MNRIQLLDCTLRDGGYINDWKFGQKNLVSVFERLADAGVDIIEIGFLDERRPFDIDRSILPDTASVAKIYGGLDRKQTMVIGMIDYGTCGIENLQPCSESFLDGIRVIFKEHLMGPAMEFCREVKALGYNVFAQLVSVTTYTEESMLRLIDLVNDVRPYAVSMVDTYGLMHPEDVLRYYELLDAHVVPEVGIGFHAHNNFQLGYANALAFVGRETERRIVVDGTLYGMGKSAGNAPIELLAMRLNEKFGGEYRIDPLLEAAQESVMDIYAKTPWGYKTFFYLCAKNKCHPNYVSYLEKQGNLSVSKVDELLARIDPEEKKLLYDKLVAEQIYQEYLADGGDDAGDKRRFAGEIEGRRLLLVGPGKNIRLQKERVSRFVREENPLIIAINYIPEDVHPDFVFLTKPSRYHDMTLELKQPENRDIRFLATSNVERRGGRFEYVVNRAPLLESSERIVDNSLLMLLNLLTDIGVKEVCCAGFDGYSDREDNYCNPNMEYSFVKSETVYLNAHMKKRIADFREQMDIRFITYSAYDAEEDINTGAV